MASVFSEVAGQFSERIFSGILWFGIFFLLAGVMAFLIWFFLVYKRKFNIQVKIISKRAGDKDNILFDRAAILTSREDKSKYFKLWSIKAELPLPNFNIIQRTDKGDYIELYREGEDKFYFLLPPKIDKKYVIRSDGCLVPIAQQSSKRMDPDMEFWMTKRKSMNRKMFDPEKMWMKILPYIPHIVSGVLIIFILYILMSHLPSILSQLRQLTTELAQSKRAEVITGIWQVLR